MHYAWGSRTVIAELLGHRSPSPEPEAEIWIGAHAAAPSQVEDDGRRRSLAEWIAESPDTRLGPQVRGRFGDTLPFLLKLLAVDTPLSLQVHPTLERARAGFAREDALGIVRSAPGRHYKDANHKPEILCAIGGFDALCGFRPAGSTIGLLEHLDSRALAPLVARIRRSPDADGLRTAFTSLMTMRREDAAPLVGEVAEACRAALDRGSEDAAQLEWTLVLARLYPEDVGVVASLLLQHVRLESGEAMFLPPGTLHTYLGGVGIELMASSDNVLRGGLTAKPIDVAGLLELVEFDELAVRSVPTVALGEHEKAFVTDTADFRLSVLSLEDDRAARPSRRGPELLLCTSGNVRVSMGGEASLALQPGDAVFVPADDAPYELSGEAQVFRATVGETA